MRLMQDIALGDAYGAGFEYVDPEIVIRHNDLTAYVKHPTHTTLRPGQYTDDAQMSIAVAEELLRDRRWNEENLAQAFVEAFARDRRDGYSRGFQALLQEVVRTPQTRWGATLLRRINKHGRTTKNGAAMRACPVGVLADRDVVRQHARVQAEVTHEGSAVDAAVAVALATHYTVYRLGPVSQLGVWLDRECPLSWAHEGTAWSVPWTGRVKGKGTNHLGVDTVRAALTAVVNAASLADCLRRSVAFTGDVDTVAAIAMGIGSAALEDDISEALRHGLEPGGKYGQAYLRGLDIRLAKLVQGGVST